MSESSKAVFLSYASQDAEAARRICERLRLAGVEVWLDDSTLRSGEAWDASIRQRIRDCALFVPVISANTQARSEGYFRREWRLAAERAGDMASTQSFLLPVVLDNIKEREALVPEEFLRVQWTWLPAGGELPPALVQRVQDLTAGGRTDRTGLSAPAQPHAGARDSGGASASPPAHRMGFRGLIGAAIVIAALAAGWFAWQRTQPAGPAEAGPKSIAVLPFTNMSDDKANAFFADGVHEDILTNLANLRELNVISRTSVMEYRGTTKKIQQIARELGVAYVLEGSVRRVGDKVRVVCQLIDGRTGQHVLAPDPYDRPLGDIFAIQSELAKNIAAKLRAALSPGEKATLETAPTANLTAYDLYLKGRQARQSEPNMRAAVTRSQPLLESAVQYDPKFALAWLELGITHLTAFNNFDASDARRVKTKEALDTAERLDPNNAMALVALGNYYIDVDDKARAEAQGERLTRLFPHHAGTYVFLARLAWRMQGDDAGSLTHFRKAYSLDPRNIELVARFANSLAARRLYVEAEALARETVDLPWGNPWQAYTLARISYDARGSTEAVEALLAKLSPEARRTDPFALRVLLHWASIRGDADGVIRLWEQSGADGNLMTVGAAFLVKGLPERARPLLEKNRDQLVATLAAQPNYRPVWSELALTRAMLGDKPAALEARQKMLGIVGLNGAYALDEGVIYAWLGEKDLALADLSRRLPVGDGLFYARNVYENRRSLMLWPLQSDPRFEALLKDPKNNAPLR